jgi:nucleotide-binding universal stress UspA family protein
MARECRLLRSILHRTKEVLMRILAATDGSPSSDVALDEIARRPWPAGSELRIVTVVNPWPPVGAEAWAIPPHYYDEVAKAARESGEKVLAAARERVEGRDGLTVSAEVLSGPTASTIVDEAERWDADLVVVGSHGYGAVKRFFLGSVSHAITLHAPCSVEVVRERKSE